MEELGNRLWEAGLVALYRELVAKREKTEREWHDTNSELIEGQYQALCAVCSLFGQRVSEIEEIETAAVRARSRNCECSPQSKFLCEYCWAPPNAKSAEPTCECSPRSEMCHITFNCVLCRFDIPRCCGGGDDQQPVCDDCFSSEVLAMESGYRGGDA